jgi:hypothetical protein
MTDSQDPVDKPALLHREESTTPDLAELTRSLIEAGDRDWDVDALTRLLGISSFGTPCATVGATVASSRTRTAADADDA